MIPDSESETVEFCDGMQDLDMALRSMTAMLNRYNRCKVYIGVGIDGSPLGINPTEEDVLRISARCDEIVRTRPTIRASIEEQSGVRYILMDVSGYETPYSWKGWFWGRARRPSTDASGKVRVDWTETPTCSMKRHRTCHKPPHPSEYGNDKMVGNGNTKPGSIGPAEEGGYVFISHSHKDFDYVRIIRNDLEEKGFQPLCFYLKCLSDDDEIEDLIKREIDCRSIFVYVNSKNSRRSRWVQMEREYIEQSGRRIDRIIDLDRDDPEEVAKNLMISMRVFISYRLCEGVIFDELKERLLERDFRVINFDAIANTADSWEARISDSIKNAALHGCYIALIPPVDDPRMMMQELEEACSVNNSESYRPYIIPVIMGDYICIPRQLSHYQCISTSYPPTSEQLDEIVTAVDTIMEERFRRADRNLPS